MRDVYLMNRETGEIVPSKEVFREFYKTHSIYDSVFDEWTDTGIEAEGSDFVELPNFSNTIAI